MFFFVPNPRLQIALLVPHLLPGHFNLGLWPPPLEEFCNGVISVAMYNFVFYMWTLWWINCWQRRVKRWFSERSVATCCSHVWWPSAGTCMNLNELVWTCKHVLRYMLFAHVWWLSAGCELENLLQTCVATIMMIWSQFERRIIIKSSNSKAC